MRVRTLPLVAELCDRSGLALGDEDRVVAESACAPGLEGDLSLEDADGVDLAAVRADCDQVRDHLRTSVGLVVEPLEEGELLPAGIGPARRLHPGRTAEG